MNSSKPAPDTMLVTLTVEQLRELVFDVVAELLSNQEPAPEYLTREALARALNVSTATVSRLRREGLPHVLVGDLARYKLADVHAWLQSRERRAPQR